VFNERKDITILSINAIDMQGRVESDAKSFDLPYTVLVGRDSDIISLYKIEKLPRILIVRRDGVIAFVDKFASYEKLTEELAQIPGTGP
jgi:hypothetical protein